MALVGDLEIFIGKKRFSASIWWANVTLIIYSHYRCLVALKIHLWRFTKREKSCKSGPITLVFQR